MKAHLQHPNVIISYLQGTGCVSRFRPGIDHGSKVQLFTLMPSSCGFGPLKVLDRFPHSSQACTTSNIGLTILRTCWGLIMRSVALASTTKQAAGLAMCTRNHRARSGCITRQQRHRARLSRTQMFKFNGTGPFMSSAAKAPCRMPWSMHHEGSCS
jgi:hypothetical protein